MKIALSFLKSVPFSLGRWAYYRAGQSLWKGFCWNSSKQNVHQNHPCPLPIFLSSKDEVSPLLLPPSPSPSLPSFKICSCNPCPISHTGLSLPIPFLKVSFLKSIPCGSVAPLASGFSLFPNEIQGQRESPFPSPDDSLFPDLPLPDQPNQPIKFHSSLFQPII